MMPVEVDWSRNDRALLTRFWEGAGQKDRAEAAEIADRILVYHRGFDKARRGSAATLPLTQTLTLNPNLTPDFGPTPNPYMNSYLQALRLPPRQKDRRSLEVVTLARFLTSV